MSLPRSSTLFVLPSAQTQARVDDCGFESLSIEELLSLVPSLKCETFEIAMSSFFRKLGVSRITWSRDDERFSTESENLREALVKAFDHLNLQRRRLA